MRRKRPLHKRLLDKRNKSIYTALFAGALIMLLLTMFFDKYALQWPFRERIVSPLPKENKKDIIIPQPTVKIPTPTSKPKKKVGFVQPVQAAEPIDQQTIIDYICSKAWDCKIAVAVARAESGLNPNRLSYSGCCKGVFQIHSVHIAKFNGVSMYDTHKNIDVAYQIYSEQGWQPWEAYTNGSYLKYL